MGLLPQFVQLITQWDCLDIVQIPIRAQLTSINISFHLINPLISFN
jgi:hypothetical protein